MSTALTVVPTSGFLVMQGDNLSRIPALMRESLGGKAIREFDLPTARVPAGGGNAWQVPTFSGEADSEKELTGVIIYAGDRRVYYAQDFEESNGGPPDCSSPDGEHGYGVYGDTPEVNHDCSKCPMSKFKSARGGDGAGTACKQQKLIGILREGDMIPLMVRLPPTSIKPFEKYAIATITMKARGYWQVITKATLKAVKGDVATYSVAVFEPVGLLSDEDSTRINVLREAIWPTKNGKPIVQTPVATPAADSDPSALK